MIQTPILVLATADALPTEPSSQPQETLWLLKAVCPSVSQTPAEPTQQRSSGHQGQGKGVETGEEAQDGGALAALEVNLAPMWQLIAPAIQCQGLRHCLSSQVPGTQHTHTVLTMHTQNTHSTQNAHTAHT